MPKIAVVLSGCGHLDGAEIRESVITLLELDKQGADVTIFAPDIPQKDVINHLTGKAMDEKRNVLVEAARIARGKVKDLSDASAEDFDALILPGGFGAAKSLSDIAEKGPGATVLPDLKLLILDFMSADKPIGVMCIAPAVLAAAVKGERKIHTTLGAEKDGKLINALGSIHQECPTRGIVIDDTNHIVSTPAYMSDAALTEVGSGISNLVDAVLNQVKAQKTA